jgi:predicted TIM-barrel fold metal-dependent hydrolase
MKIDTHQHYWRYHAAEFAWISDAMPGLQRDCMPQDCANARHAAGVDAVVAVQARTHRSCPTAWHSGASTPPSKGCATSCKTNPM